MAVSPARQRGDAVLFDRPVLADQHVDHGVGTEAELICLSTRSAFEVITTPAPGAVEAAEQLVSSASLTWPARR